MTENQEKIAEILRRHQQRQEKINNAARDASEGNGLAALCHGRSQEHDDRGSLLVLLSETTQERDRERARADKAEAALVAAREKVKALPGLVTAGGWHIIGGVEKDLVLAALGIEVSPQVNAGKELAPG